MTAAPTRPIMRYLGGKWLLAPWIISHFPSHRTYAEPFGGVASVLLRKPRSRAEIYNDADGEIVNLFRVLRSPVESRELVRTVRLTPFSRHEYETAFLLSGDPIEQARRTLVKSAMGFGSNSVQRRTGFRPGYTRQGQTPAGDWSNLPGSMTQIIERLRGVIVEERPALEIIHRYDSADTLFYVDPPYVHATRGDDSRYRLEMSDDDHREMAATLRRARGMIVVSGYSCALYDTELFTDWQRIDYATHADGGRDRIESLWLSPNIRIPQMQLLEITEPTP